MTFEEAGARFVQLQSQWRAGMLTPAQYQQIAAQLSVQDSTGRWWQLDPNSGQWMAWNGAQWVIPQQAAAPQYVPQTAVPQYVQQAAPQYAPQAVAPPHAPQIAPLPYAPQAATQQRTLRVPARKIGPTLIDGLAPVLPGIAIEMFQRWSIYRQDPLLLANFAVPSLLPTVVMPLVPTIGRVAATLIVLGCLGWLSWPLISHASEITGSAAAVQSHAGRGLVGVSMIYIIPRIWKAGR